MLCIGYGRHPPQNIPETCVTISSMMTGATFYALFIAYSINVIQTMDSPGRNYKEKVCLVCSLMVLMCYPSVQIPCPFVFFYLQFTASSIQPTFPFDVSRMMSYQFKGPYDYEFITGRFKHAI